MTVFITDKAFTQKYSNPWKRNSFQGAEAIIYKSTYEGKDIIIREELETGVNKKEDAEIMNFKTVEGAIGEHKNVVIYKEASLKYSVYELQSEGDMQRYIDTKYDDNDKKDTDFKVRLGLCKDMIKGVQHIHNRGFVHYDIKPDNVLLHKENGKLVAKIGDFGRTQVWDGRSTMLTLRYYPEYPISRLYSESSDHRFLDIHALCFTILSVLAWHPEIICEDDDDSCRTGVLFPLEDLEIPETSAVYKSLVRLIEGTTKTDRFSTRFAKLKEAELRRVVQWRKKLMVRKTEVLGRIYSQLRKRSGSYSLEDKNGPFGLGAFGEEVWRGIMGMDFSKNARATTTKELLATIEKLLESMN
jgi:serine/threonine protein kinase